MEGDNALRYLHKDNKNISQQIFFKLKHFALMFAFKIVHFRWSVTQINLNCFYFTLGRDFIKKILIFIQPTEQFPHSPLLNGHPWLCWYPDVYDKDKLG